MTDYAYTALDAPTRLALAQDALRGREADHFRVSLLDEPNKEDRMLHMEAEIENIKAAITALEAEVDAQTPEEPSAPASDPTQG